MLEAWLGRGISFPPFFSGDRGRVVDVPNWILTGELADIRAACGELWF
ncbi:hypothetical protein [Mesorhizobium sp. WSM4315]|nr:hypothetical protein [Mesorhizobium sp. WSM4315]